jgi:glycosyltransferase involved in cell wall biosynthesis
MRILVAHNVDRKRTGGMSRIMGYHHDVVTGAGHEVDYFCADDVPAPVHTSLQRFAFPLAVRRHVALERQAGRPFDIVNVHEPSAAGLLLRRGRSDRTKVVVTSHGIEQRAWEERLAPGAGPDERPSWKTRIVHPTAVLWQARFALRHADHIFCLNQDDAAFVRERYGRRPDDITRIFPAAAAVYGRRAAARDYAAVRSLVFAASWLPRKGIRTLMESFCRIAAAHPDIELQLLNPGAAEADVLAAFPPAFRGRVRCIAAAPDEGTAAVLESADIFVLPSLFEGTPLTLMESMWSGLPIVTTDTCGMKDVIANGRNGLLVPPRSVDALTASLERLIRDRALRESLGRTAARDAVSLYTWERTGTAVLEAYERLFRHAASNEAGTADT